MSTEHECFLVVGNDMDTAFRTARSVAEELGKPFPYHARCAWAESLPIHTMLGKCDFFGIQVSEDGEEIEFRDYDLAYPNFYFEERCRKARKDFEEATGVVALLKPIIFEY